MKLSRVKHFLLALVLAAPTLVNANTGDQTPGWLDTAWQHVSDTWETGDVELYVPFLTYHMPWAYRDDLLNSYNEYPAGAGLGKGRFNSNGNWESIYAMGFLDSHSKPSFMAGYAWAPTWELGSDIKVGVGLTGFLMSRSDYWNGIPFPGILPIASIGYKRLTIQAAYVPGGQNNGNVLFMWGKWTFDK
jgi:lipid IVA palmitoyltransferase